MQEMKHTAESFSKQLSDFSLIPRIRHRRSDGNASSSSCATQNERTSDSARFLQPPSPVHRNRGGAQGFILGLVLRKPDALIHTMTSTTTSPWTIPPFLLFSCLNGRCTFLFLSSLELYQFLSGTSPLLCPIQSPCLLFTQFANLDISFSPLLPLPGSALIILHLKHLLIPFLPFCPLVLS